MVHGGLPGPRLCWPSVKEKRKEECEAPLLLERSFSQNCHFSPEQSVSQRVRDCVRPAQVNLRCGCAGLDWEWWWWLVGGWEGRRNRQDSEHLLGNSSHSFTDRPDTVTHGRSNRRKYLGKVKEKTRPRQF